MDESILEQIKKIINETYISKNLLAIIFEDDAEELWTFFIHKELVEGDLVSLKLVKDREFPPNLLRH